MILAYKILEINRKLAIYSKSYNYCLKNETKFYAIFRLYH